MKEFSSRQVFIIILTTVVVIGFIETSMPVWTTGFWREFLLNLLIYSAVSGFVMIFLGSWKKK